MSNSRQKPGVSEMVVVYPGLLGGFTLLMMFCKWVGIVSWDWWVVMLPLWLPWALIIAIVVVMGVGHVVSLGLTIIVAMIRNITQ